MFKIPQFKAPDFSRDVFKNAPDVKLEEVRADGVAPEYFHSTSMYPEYFKIDGEWQLLEESRMDCVPVLRADGKLEAKEFRRLKKGEPVVLGRSEDCSEGIFLHDKGFEQEGKTEDEDGAEAFAFRSGRTRETSFSKDYHKLVSLLKHDKDHGHIVWVLGPAAVFDKDSRKAMEYIIENGYCHALFGGNAVATHDLEASMFNTALGQDMDTCENVFNGHYKHLDLLNRVKKAGSIPKAVEEYNLSGGVIHACVKNDVPFVLAGSIRDDGPLPEVNCSTNDVQDEMRFHTKKATTVICLATQLHTIATGNLTPCYVTVKGNVRPVFIYAVDVSEFVLNKIRDRGTLEVTTLVSNIQDFLFKVSSFLKND